MGLCLKHKNKINVYLVPLLFKLQKEVSPFFLRKCQEIIQKKSYKTMSLRK